MFKRTLLPFFAMIISRFRAIETRLAALEADDVAETDAEAATEVDMQKLLDEMTGGETAPAESAI